MNFPCPKCGGHGTAFFANIMRGEVHNNEKIIAVMIMICLLAFSFSAGAGNTNKNTADLVVYGTIYTDEDGDNEIVEAFAVKDGKGVSEGTVPIDT